jgi:hypothetical protein
VKHKYQYSITLRFSTIGSGSTQVSITKPRRLLSGRLKLGVHFFEVRSGMRLFEKRELYFRNRMRSTVPGNNIL